MYFTPFPRIGFFFFLPAPPYHTFCPPHSRSVGRLLSAPCVLPDAPCFIVCMAVSACVFVYNSCICVCACLKAQKGGLCFVLFNLSCLSSGKHLCGVKCVCVCMYVWDTDGKAVSQLAVNPSFRVSFEEKWKQKKSLRLTRLILKCLDLRLFFIYWTFLIELTSKVKRFKEVSSQISQMHFPM